jgi:hypothetical protein
MGSGGLEGVFGGFWGLGQDFKGPRKSDATMCFGMSWGHLGHVGMIFGVFGSRVCGFGGREGDFGVIFVCFGRYFEVLVGGWSVLEPGKDDFRGFGGFWVFWVFYVKLGAGMGFGGVWRSF